VSSTWGDKIDNTKDSVVFFYSKDCHSCKRFGPIFERVAYESNRERNKEHEFSMAKYYRINGTYNAVRDIINYPWTPIFMVIKKGYKDKPLILRPTFLTPQMFLEFIENSLKWEIMDEKVAERLFSKESL